MTIDETLTKSESGMSGPCNRETPACSVIQPRQYDGIGEFVCPPRKKTSRDKFTQMTASRGQNWPVVPYRPYCAHHQACPESTYTSLQLWLCEAPPAKFLAPWADGQAKQTCARRGEPMGRCVGASQSRQNKGDQSEQSWPEQSGDVPERPDSPPAKLSQ